MNMNTFNYQTKPYITFVQDDTFTTVASLILIIYAVFIAPYLSEQISSLFDNMLVKIILFGIIAYLSRYNPTVALIATIAVIVSLMRSNEFSVTNNVLIRNASFTQSQNNNEYEYENNYQYNHIGDNRVPKFNANIYKYNCTIPHEIPQEIPQENADNIIISDEKVNSIISEYRAKKTKLNRDLDFNEINQIANNYQLNNQQLNGQQLNNCQLNNQQPNSQQLNNQLHPESEFTDDNLELLKCMGKDKTNIMENVQEFNSMESNFAEFNN